MQTATDDSLSAAQPAKKQKIDPDSPTFVVYTGDEAAEDPTDVRDDEADDIPEWGAAGRNWCNLNLNQKIQIFDLLVKIVPKRPKGQSIEQFIKATACMAATTYHTWNTEKRAEGLRAFIEEDPRRGFFSMAFGFDLHKYLTRDDKQSVHDQIKIAEAMAKAAEAMAEAEAIVLEQEAKDNAELTLAALKDHVPSNVTVIDGTSGERIFLSDEETVELYTCVLVDKYKNQVQSCSKYKGVLSYDCDEFKAYISSRVAMAFIWDPPYRTINGGHSIVNCTMSKSHSRIRFNMAYGVEYKYTNEMINAMYLRGFYWADKLLHEDGVFLVKCMLVNDGFAQQQAIIEMAEIYGFCLKAIRTLKSRMKKNDSSKNKDSYLLVMVRKQQVKSLKEMYSTAASEAAEYKGNLASNINNRAAAAYVKATTESLDNGKRWANACEKLREGLNEEQQRNAFKDILEERIDSFKSFQKKDAEIRQQLTVRYDNNSEWQWEELQSLALSSQTIFLDMKNLAGLLFEQHLLKRNINIEDDGSLQQKQELQVELIGRSKGLRLVNKTSHVSLSRNIQILRDEKDEEKRRQKEAEQKAEKEKQKKKQQNILRNFLKPTPK